MFNALHTWAKYQFWIHICDLKIRSWAFEVTFSLKYEVR